MSKTAKILLIVGGIMLAVVLIAVIGIALIAESMGKPEVAENSVLVLNVSGDLPDYSADDPTAQIFGFKQSQSFSSLLTQLRKAKVDKRIGGVLLEINLLDAGWGKADELRGAIADFRASGKPLYAYIEVGTNKEYYIASAAERIYVSPSGDLFINGFAARPAAITTIIVSPMARLTASSTPPTMPGSAAGTRT